MVTVTEVSFRGDAVCRTGGGGVHEHPEHSASATFAAAFRGHVCARGSSSETKFVALVTGRCVAHDESSRGCTRHVLCQAAAPDRAHGQAPAYAASATTWPLKWSAGLCGACVLRVAAAFSGLSPVLSAPTTITNHLCHHRRRESLHLKSTALAGGVGASAELERSNVHKVAPAIPLPSPHLHFPRTQPADTARTAKRPDCSFTPQYT